MILRQDASPWSGDVTLSVTFTRRDLQGLALRRADLEALAGDCRDPVEVLQRAAHLARLIGIREGHDLRRQLEIDARNRAGLRRWRREFNRLARQQA